LLNFYTICRPMARGLSRMLSAGYPLVGGTRQRDFDGTNFKPHKLSENEVRTPSRVVS